MARRPPLVGPSPVYPIVEKFVNDEYTKLDSTQVTPWAFLHAGAFRLSRFHGDLIAYNGISFNGSPRSVFWNRYIEPFLEDISFRAIDLTVKEANERKIALHQPLMEVQGQLYGLCRRTFDRMAAIDRNLRFADAHVEAPVRPTDNEIAQMRQFIDRRINAELAAISESPGFLTAVNQWYKDHPIVPWLVSLPFAVLGACKALGLF